MFRVTDLNILAWAHIFLFDYFFFWKKYYFMLFERQKTLKGKPHNLTRVLLKALPGKFDIKKHSPSILYDLDIKHYHKEKQIWAA